MNLLVKGNYEMYMFSKHHIQSIIALIILGIIIIAIPYFLNKKNKIQYFKLLGIFYLFYKIFDIYYRIEIEKFNPIECLPLHICNISIVLAGIYLYTQNNKLYNILYYLFFTYTIVLIIPGSFEYSTPFYIYIYLFGHIGQLYAIILGRLYSKQRITKKNIIYPIIMYLGFAIIMYFIINPKLETNFMYVNYYILKEFSFIKPLKLYTVLFIITVISSMFFMRLFVKNKK